MTNPPLSVDPEQLSAAGGALQSAAADLPPVPPPFMPTGTDPLSAAIIGQIPAVEGPITTQLPLVKTQATETATNVVNAAQAYVATDQRLGGQIGQEMQDAPAAAGLGSGGAAASAAGSAAGAAGSAGSAAGSAGSAGGAMSQMMGMPMQMAQMPMQMMGAVAAVPQGVMQGAQQVGQQVQQMVGQFGGAGQSGSGGMGGVEASVAEPPAPESPRDTSDGASSGDPEAERAPEAKEKADDSAGRHRAPEPADSRINV